MTTEYLKDTWEILIGKAMSDMKTCNTIWYEIYIFQDLSPDQGPNMHLVEIIKDWARITKHLQQFIT